MQLKRDPAFCNKDAEQPYKQIFLKNWTVYIHFSFGLTRLSSEELLFALSESRCYSVFEFFFIFSS